MSVQGPDTHQKEVDAGKGDAAESQLKRVEAEATDPPDFGSVRGVMVVLIMICLFCVSVLFGPDHSTVPADANLQIPIANIKIHLRGFLFIGPLVVIAFTLYLHIFFEAVSRQLRESHHYSDKYVFTMKNRAARIVTGFLFYWMPCLVLFAFALRTLPRPESALLLAVSLWFSVFLLNLYLHRRMPRRGIWPFLASNSVIALALISGFYVGGPEEGGGWIESVRAVLHEMRPLDLVRADLQGSDLRNVKLDHASLDKAKLAGANLERATLNGVEAVGARFEYADLGSARLVCAQLKSANLQGANLSSADLRGANLQYADLTNAEMELVILDSVAFDADRLACDPDALNGGYHPILAQIEKLDGGGVDQDREAEPDSGVESGREAVLTGANLTGVKLRGARLTGARLSLATLDQADMPEVELFFSKLNQASLAGGVSLRNSWLTCADLKDADLTEAILENANAEAVDLTAAVLNGADLTGAKLSCFDCSDTCCFEQCRYRLAPRQCEELEGEERKACSDKKCPSCEACRARGSMCASLSGAYLKGAKLVGADLRGADLTEADLTGADLTDADLANADLRGAKGLSCNQLMKANGWVSSFRDEACGEDVPRPSPEGEENAEIEEGR